MKEIISTSVAHIMERQWRLNNWLTLYVMGNGPTPNDLSSVPEPNHVEIISGDTNGQLKDTEQAYDLSSIPTNANGDRVITFNVLSNLSTSLNTYIYLTLSDLTIDPLNVKIYLEYNGTAISNSSIIPNQVKFLKISTGKPVGIYN
jgi:hypothetical protein